MGSCSGSHIRELPILRYHIIRVNYPYPLLGVICWVILHYFIGKNYHKTSQIVTLSPHYGKLPYFSLNYHIIYFQKKSKYSLSQKNTRTIYQKRVTSCNFWNISSHRNNCFLFLELFSIIYQAHSVCSSVRSVFRHFIIWYLICVFSIFIVSSVILVDIKTGIITTF